jgi:hypothetical protein
VAPASSSTPIAKEGSPKAMLSNAVGPESGQVTVITAPVNVSSAPRTANAAAQPWRSTECPPARRYPSATISSNPSPAETAIRVL